MGFQETRQVFSGQCRENVKEKKAAKAAVAHRSGTDHKELADRLTSMQHIDRQARLGSAADGRIALSRTFVAPVFTADKKSRFDIKFVKWIVRKNRPVHVQEGRRTQRLRGRSD